jgi:hypothetical protein
MGDLMTNTYKAISVVGEHYFGEGVVELDLSVVEEKDALSSHHLEIVPRKYQVLSDNYEAGEQGAMVELALLKENEAALIQGGHIARVDEPSKESKEKPAPKAADQKEK